MLSSVCQPKRKEKSILFSLQQGKGNLSKFSLGSLYTDTKPSKCRQALPILQPQISQIIWVVLLLYSKAFSRATSTSYLEQSRQNTQRIQGYAASDFWTGLTLHLSSLPRAALDQADIPWGLLGTLCLLSCETGCSASPFKFYMNTRDFFSTLMDLIIESLLFKFSRGVNKK